MVLHEIGSITGQEPQVRREPWRPGDQHYFVSDTRLLQKELRWQSEITWREGIRDLAQWLCDTRGFELNNNKKKRMSA
jgi:CDP-paratose 2-epimerase